MSIEVKVPQLPESVTDATLVSWHKKPGDAVGRDENLVDLETDKVVLEVPAPSAGVIKELKVENGATVTSGQVLAILEAGEGAVCSRSQRRRQPEAQAAAAAAAKAACRRCRWQARAVGEAHGRGAQARCDADRRQRPRWPHQQGRCDSAHRGQGRRIRGTGGEAGQQPAVQLPTAARRAQRTARTDDAPACAHRRAADPGAVDCRDADDVQRSRPDGGERDPRPLQGQVREDARREARLHVVLHQGSDRSAAQVPGGQCVDRRQRHRLSRVLRHRRGGLDRSRPDGAGAAQCRVA